MILSASKRRKSSSHFEKLKDLRVNSIRAGLEVAIIVESALEAAISNVNRTPGLSHKSK